MKLSKKEYAEKKRKEIEKQLDELAQKLCDPEQVFEFLKTRCFSVPESAPLKTWSLTNQLLVLMLSDTVDARGYRQWLEVDRNVKKGCSSKVSILVPCFRKELNERTGEEENVLKYFTKVPVFGVEDTEGKELEYQKDLRENGIQIDSLPLLPLCSSLNIKVESKCCYTANRLGSFSVSLDGKKKISLCTDAEQTFFHEIAHAVDHELGNLQHSDNEEDHAVAEIVAEFSSCFLAGVYGRKVNLGKTQKYVNYYANNVGKHPSEMLAIAMGRTIEIIEYINNFETSLAISA